MELEELKAGWESLNTLVQKQEILNQKIMLQLTEQKYRSKLTTIVYPEAIGCLVCLITVAVLAYNAGQFDTTFLQLEFGGSIVSLLALCFLSFKSTNGLRDADLGAANYTETLREFLEKKVRFQKLQKANIWISFFFALVFLPVASKLISGMDINSSTLLYIAVPLLCLFQVVVSRWVFKHYNAVLAKTQILLNGLE